MFCIESLHYTKFLTLKRFTITNNESIQTSILINLQNFEQYRSGLGHGFPVLDLFCLDKRLILIKPGWHQEGHPVTKFCHFVIYEIIKSDTVKNYIKWTELFRSEDSAQDRASVRCRPNQTAVYRLHHLNSYFASLRVCSLNVGELWDTSWEMEEMLKHRSADICYLQETRFRKSLSKWLQENLHSIIYSGYEMTG